MGGYKISELQTTLRELQAVVPGLEAEVDWTGQTEDTDDGPVPTVTFRVSRKDNERKSDSPVPVTDAPAAIAQALRLVLGKKINAEAEMYLEMMSFCPVT